MGPLSLKKAFIALLILCFILIFWILSKNQDQISTNYSPSRQLIVHRAQCNLSEQNWYSNDNDDLISHTKKSAKVLIISETSFSKVFKAVTQILVANKIKYKSAVAGKKLPDLIKVSKGLGKYGVIFFEEYKSYLNMDPWYRNLLDKYCKTFKVGIVALISSTTNESIEDSNNQKNKDIHLRLSSLNVIDNISVNESSSILRVTRGGLTETISSKDWSGLHPTHTTYSSVAWTTNKNQKIPVVLQDHGQLDEIPKVLFGGDIYLWINRLLFLDSLSWVSNNRIAIPLTRYILIDIDDIFVGKHRMIPSDVEALIESQQRIRKLVNGFTYNLGFSGGYFHSGTPEQNLGDDALIAFKDKFWWFPHMWKHQQPHLIENTTQIIKYMKDNHEFAIKNNIPVTNNYSVAPHHSGTYPVYEPLYEAWNKVWNIRVTSTEQYPHFKPPFLRGGFYHNNIKVLPRQTCGLYTKNLFYSEYPNGPEVLENSIKGGELFQTILFNRVNIFMTHMPNYCYDRLAPYTFESVFTKLKCWTQLDLRTKKPIELANTYFKMFPDEQNPIWGNPCDDNRHMDIWSSDSESCDQLPNLLVIGPQKTGTTAFYTFLKMHPSIKSNKNSPDSFEELQFFSGDNYQNGIDWYMSFFPNPDNQETDEDDEIFLFEKSATYFDHELSPIRAHRMLPDAKIIAILISPIKRAYSWYHHMKAHNNPTALFYSFHEVITADSSSPKPLKKLQNRCLEPGKYSVHIEKWLNFYKSKDIFIMDGEKLKEDPSSIMNYIQHFLDVKPFFDYTDKLVYDNKKGFYCEVLENGHHKCLGKGKGRNYPSISMESQKYLRNYYRLYNEALLKLLTRLGYSTPKWLEEDLQNVSNKKQQSIR